MDVAIILVTCQKKWIISWSLKMASSSTLYSHMKCLHHFSFFCQRWRSFFSFTTFDPHLRHEQIKRHITDIRLIWCIIDLRIQDWIWDQKIDINYFSPFVNIGNYCRLCSDFRFYLILIILQRKICRYRFFSTEIHFYLLFSK